jgi:hypothetical protein
MRRLLAACAELLPIERRAPFAVHGVPNDTGERDQSASAFLAHWRYCRTYFLALLGLALAFPCLLNFIVDPWQYFRKASYYPDLSANGRYQNPGLAWHYPYDTAILGSSLSVNFYPAEMKRRLGYSALRLALAGGTPYEQRLLLDIALSRRTLKHVFWGIDAENFGGPIDRVYSGTGPFPWYMYDHMPWSVALYLLNGDNLSRSLHLLDGMQWRLKHGDDNAVETLGTWDKGVTYGRDKILATYFENPAPGKVYESLDGAYELNGMKRSFAHNVLDPIDRAPNVDFIIILPPVSILLWKFIAERDPAIYETIQEMGAHMRIELAARPNVRLFDFQDLSEITFDLDNYKDIRHYSGAINSYIIESVAANRHRVPSANPGAAIERLRAQVSSYPAPAAPPATAGTTELH